MINQIQLPLLQISLAASVFNKILLLYSKDCGGHERKYTVATFYFSQQKFPEKPLTIMLTHLIHVSMDIPNNKIVGQH